MIIETIAIAAGASAACLYLGRLIERRWPRSPAAKEMRQLNVELQKTTTDRDFGLVEKEMKKQPRAEASLMLPDLEVPFATWKDEDSPISFFVSLDVHRKTAPQPAVHTVEVLRLQETIRDVVHERVVYQTVDGVDANQPKAEVVDLLDLADNVAVKAAIEIAVEEAIGRRLGSGKVAETDEEHAARVRRRQGMQQKQ